MKLLVFIDFTAFCAGKKKKPPHISPQVCPVSNGSHGCQQIPNPFLLRWVTQEANMSMCNSFNKHAWEGSWRRMEIDLEGFLETFLSWTTENLDSGTERPFNTPYSENRRLGLGFARWFSANGNSNLCWGIIVLWQILWWQLAQKESTANQPNLSQEVLGREDEHHSPLKETHAHPGIDSKITSSGHRLTLILKFYRIWRPSLCRWGYIQLPFIYVYLYQ